MRSPELACYPVTREPIPCVAFHLTLLREDPLAFAVGDYVSRDDVTDDAGDENVAARFGHQPAAPLELVERGVQGVSLQVRRAADPARRHPVPQSGGGDQGLLRGAREAAKVDADRRDDGVRQVAGKRRIE